MIKRRELHERVCQMNVVWCDVLVFIMGMQCSCVITESESVEIEKTKQNACACLCAYLDYSLDFPKPLLSN